MSRETTEARFAARESERKWKEHQEHCSSCAHAARVGDPLLRCTNGNELAMVKAEDGRELARQRKLDKQPAPDQEPLFP